jgi:glycosyltransferase involved in cell wall biosynthesis
VRGRVAAVASRFEPEEIRQVATIGIDVTALSAPAPGGIGTSQYQTMRALADLDAKHRYVMFAAAPPFVPFSQMPLDLPWPLRLGSGLAARSNIVWMQTGVNRALADDGVEVFWGPRHLLPLRARGIARVATVHDFWHHYHPGQQPWANRLADRLLIKRVIASADVVVAPSAATALDVERLGGLEPGSTRVVPWGVDAEVFRAQPRERVDAVLSRLGARPPYLLSLDVFNARKNFRLVLEAVSRLSDDVRGPLQLVAVGRGRGGAKDVDPRAGAGALGLGDRLRLVGDLPPEDLAALYAGALALVYPSVYEGFGMPVLEAMACGCPVIAADTSSLPEVAGEAALLVDTSSSAALRDAISLLATDADERARLVAAGVTRAAGFSWRRAAEGMLEAFEAALQARASGHRR